jgi:hypothetical protein
MQDEYNPRTASKNAVVVPMGTTPEPKDSGRATEKSLCMVKWIYPLVG